MIVLVLLAALVVVVIVIGIVTDAVSRKRHKSVSTGEHWSSEYDRKQYAADLKVERHELYSHGLVTPQQPPPPTER